MAKVYVSSTYQDLKEHRREVELALRRLGHVDIAMEYYTAETRPARERCLEDVAACDLYIGVFAWRHGWAPEDENPEGCSITELEYREAQRTNRPCLIFLLNEDAPWPPRFIDKDRTRIEKLREELSARHMAAPFSTPQDLAAAVTQSVAQWERQDAKVLEFSHYFDVLRRRYRRVDLDALTPPQREEYLQLELRSIFVEQHVRRGTPPPEGAAAAAPADGEQAGRDLYDEEPRPVLELITDARSRLIVILGNPGSGKSTLSRYLLLSMIDVAAGAGTALNASFEGFLPFLLELRSFVALSRSGKCETFVECLDYLGKTEGWRMGEGAIGEYLGAGGKAFLIFDGLDEIFDPDERERVTQQIALFAELYPAAKVIVTSRIVGYRRRILSEANFQHATLQDLDEGQVDAFIARWYGLAIADRPEEAQDRRERLMRGYRDSASIRQLAGNPLLLTIMAIIGKHQELPRERWKLYDHAASVLIQHWDVNKHLSQARVDAELMDEEDRKHLLRRLAFQMQGAGGGPAGNYIDRDQLQTVFARYLEERYQEPPVRANQVARAMIDQFRERNFILCLYGAGLYGFVHRAFLEYFCASAYVFRFEKTHEIALEDLKALFLARWRDQSWHEVLRLICGMIGEKFAGEIVQTLLQADAGWLEAPEPWNLALGVRCLGELRNLSAVAGAANSTLMAVCAVFDSPEVDRRFVRDELVRPVVAIGSDWPPCRYLAGWIGDRRYRGHTWSDDQLFGSLMAALARGSEECRRALLEYLTRRPVYYRPAAIAALAAGWRDDPRTKILLRGLAAGDPDGDVRAAAVTSLMEHFAADEDARAAVRERLTTDRSWVVRFVAVWALAAHYGSDEAAIPLLEEQALRDPAERVQAAAREALAEYHPRSAVTLTLLLDRRTRTNLEGLLGGAVPDLERLLRLAAEHEDDAARETVLTILTQHFSHLPEVFPLLRDRALNDEQAAVRMCALGALGEKFSDAPQTFSLLRARARADKHPWARETALGVLAERYQREPGTVELIRERVCEDPEAFVREWGIDWLRRSFQKDWRTVPLLIERFKLDPDEGVRRRAAGALVDIAPPDPRVAAALWLMAQDPAFREYRIGSSYGSSGWNPQAETWAIFWMEWHSNEPLDDYWKEGADLERLIERDAREHPRFSVRCTAAAALDQEYGPRPDLLTERAAKDPDFHVRVTALRLLESRGHEVAGPALERALEDVDGELRADAVRLIRALRRDEGPHTERFRTLLTSDPSASVRRAAAHALASEIEDVEVVCDLRRSAAEDPDARVRTAAIESLWPAQDWETLLFLTERAANESDAVVRLTAREAVMASTAGSQPINLLIHGWSALLKEFADLGSRLWSTPHRRVQAADNLWRDLGCVDNWAYEGDAEEFWRVLKRACVEDPDSRNRFGFLFRAIHWFAGRPELKRLLEERAGADPDSIVRKFADAACYDRVSCQTPSPQL